MRYGKLVFSAALLLMLPAALPAQDASWEQLRGPYGGVVSALEVCSSDGRVYVGTFDGLLYSDDDGMTWQYLRYDFIGVHALLADDAGGLAVGCIAGVSLVHRDDMTWSYCPETEPYVIWSMHRGRMSGTLFAGSNNGTVLRSTDGGLWWQPVSVTTLTPNKVTAVTSDVHGNVFIGTSATRVWKSTDDGLTWRNVSAVTQHNNVLSMEYDADADVLYVGVKDTIYASTDAGEQWSASVFGQGAVKSSLPLCVTADGRLRIGTSTGVLESADHGRNWTRLAMGIDDSAVTVMTFDRVTGRTYVATKSGVYHMASNADQWELCGAPTNDIYSIDVIGTDRIVAATGSGIQVSSDGGRHWTQSTLGLMFSTALDPAIGMMYAAGNSGVYRSTDLGSNWTLAMKPAGTRPWTVRVLPGGDVVAGFGAVQNWGGVYLSRDLGLTWEARNEGLVDTDVYWIEVDAETGIVYLCTAYGELYRSTDACASWTSLPAPWTAASASLAVRPPASLYAATCTKGIYVSRDAGLTWTQIGQGHLETACANWITYDAKGCLYVGISAGGVWTSCDDGAHWSELGRDFGHYNVYCLEMSENGDLYAGAEVGGMFRIALPTAAARTPAAPSPAAILQNVPNPFTEMTRFTIEGWRPGEAYALRVYDVLGGMVCDLSAQAVSGPAVTLDGSMLPRPGVYFCELTTAHGTSTRTFVHLR